MFASFLVFHREFASMGPFPPNQCDEKRQDVLIVVGNGNVDTLSLLLALFTSYHNAMGITMARFSCFVSFPLASRVLFLVSARNGIANRESPPLLISVS
jgi:hypothetical protein